MSAMLSQGLPGVRFIAFVAALAAAFASSLPAFSYREALAQNAAPCDAPDPGDARAVYQCAQTGRARLDRLTCSQARENYQRLLTGAGMTSGRAQQYLPSCEILAGVILDVTGETPAWNGCLGHPGSFDREHFKRCLGTIPERNTCPLLIQTYRRGLMAADRYGQLPRGYSDPDCQTVAAALAPPAPSVARGEEAGPQRRAQLPGGWAKCLDYDPANAQAHMKQCLGPELAAFTTCESVQRAYERNLREAYNGLPAGYVMVTCPEAQTIVRLGAAQAEERRKAAEAARIARAEQIRIAREMARSYPQNPVTQRGTGVRSPGKSAEKSGSWIIWVLVAAAILGWLFWLTQRRSTGQLATDWGESDRGAQTPWWFPRSWTGEHSSPDENPFKPAEPTGTRRDDQPFKEARPQTRPQPETRSQITDPLKELERMVGLAEVKKQVAELAALVKYQQQRKAAGLPAGAQSYHLVFTGNPGTGKTTVAQIIGAIYRSLGVLTKGHLVQVGRKDLVGQNWGSGGEKTGKALEQALDGILFIDEAYALNLDHKSSSGDALGHEAIATLIDAMERNRDRLAVIAAGYTKEMERFFQSNPGLASRFGTRIEFPDYRPDDLTEIFRRMCAAERYRISQAAEAKLASYVKALYENRRQDFGNGREVRNLFEKSVRRLAIRLGGSGKAGSADLTTLTDQDIPDLAEVTRRK